MSRQKKLNGAIALFENFTGHTAKHVDTIAKPEYPDVAVKVGKCLGIMYECVRDGKREKYLHEFRGNSRPLLIASHDGKGLYFVGGNYIFKDTGINDK